MCCAHRYLKIVIDQGGPVHKMCNVKVAGVSPSRSHRQDESNTEAKQMQSQVEANGGASDKEGTTR